MDSDDYYTAGVVLALSVVHGGPAPRFLSRELFMALINGPDTISVSVDKLPDSDISRQLKEVCCYLYYCSRI